MKIIMKLKKPCALKNQGFSLLELLISITILVLILVPLMNNFYHSMLMNKKAEEIQKQSNLASSIMEGLKSLDMEETINEFTAKAPFDIISGSEGQPGGIMVLNYDTSTGIYAKIESSLSGQSTYYFAINGIQKGGSVYDALIKMNANSYVNEEENVLNSYPMPDAINLNDKVNGLLYSTGEVATDTIDSKALATFVKSGTAYAKSQFEQSSKYKTYLADYTKWKTDCEIAEMQEAAQPTPTPPPDMSTFDPAEYSSYCNEENVKACITKTMTVSVNQNTLNTLKYIIHYYCKWPEGSNIESNLDYKIVEINYAQVLKNIYLFYQPSEFKNTVTEPEQIMINNETPNKPINFYLANQNQSIKPNLLIKRIFGKDASNNDYIPTPISLFTNQTENVQFLKNDQYDTGYNTDIVDTEVKNRIYDVEVNIYETVASDDPADKYKKKLYSLSSTREN